MSRRFVYACIFLSIFITIFANNHAFSESQDAPNVIFILLDAARPDHFSCYGYNETTTPCIDEIRQEGALFQNHFAQQTYTRASLASMFSSRYFSVIIPSDNDIWGWGAKQEDVISMFMKFDPQQALLQDSLSKHGYHTVVFSEHGWFTAENWFLDKFDEYFKISFEKNENLDRRRDTPAFIKDMAFWIKQHKKNKFFMYWHCLAPHPPYRVDRSVFDATMKSLGKKDCAENDCEEKIKFIRGLYDDNLRYADTLVGAFYDQLKKLGILDKTLLIITADHGEQLFEGHGYGHGQLPWDSVIHVPLIMVYPPFIQRGCAIKGLTESVDIMPTILDICGISLPKDKSMDGVSLVEYFTHPDKSKEAVFTEQSMRTREYKYILPDKLYNIQKDPQEQVNLIKKEPAVAKQLKSAYSQKMRPYTERYENSKREMPLKYPFYVTVADLEISAPGPVLKTDEKNDHPDNYLKKDWLPKQWVLNKPWGYERLTFPPYYPPLPVILSSELPDDSYQVYLLIASPREISCSIEQLGLRYRFSPEERLRYPADISPARNPLKKEFYYYLSLGQAVVRKNRFSLQLDFQPKTKAAYSIIHTKFIPGEIKYGAAARATPEKEQERKERIDRLKSLGYL